MPTTAGSWALAGSSPSDAFIVQRLRAAGAMVIAKANLSEWANFRSAPSSSGWSGIGGQTNMAYVLDRNPCGSSSGTGVGVSADLATVGVGTETDGSIVCPSGANGIVGIKPTLGPVEPGRHRADLGRPGHGRPDDPQRDRRRRRAGRRHGHRRQRSGHRRAGGPRVTDYTPFLDAHALEGARIGVLHEGTLRPAAHPEIDAIMADVIATLEDQGAIVVDPADIHIGPRTSRVPALLCEFKSDIASYLQTYTAAGLPQHPGHRGVRGA